MRRDLADIFCSIEEGVKGQRAKDWRLVDEVIPNSKFADTVEERAHEFAAKSSKADVRSGITLNPLERTITDDAVSWSTVTVDIDRAGRIATFTIKGPAEDPPADMDDFQAQGDQAYLLKLCRDLEDAILHMRFNEMEIGLWVFCAEGDPQVFAAHEALLAANAHHWLANEVRQYWKRTLKRIDVTSRSLVAFIEHGSCFSGMLAEILFAVDRSYMMDCLLYTSPSPRDS